MTRQATADDVPSLGKPDLPLVSVIVPTFRRPKELLACLQGLSTQSRLPLEVVVVRRAGDEPTANALRTFRGSYREVVVTAKGVVAALQAGAAVTQGDVVAFIDDDAVPRLDWIRLISAQFVDDSVGGVGGRDEVHTTAGVIRGSERRVGRVGLWGRAVGNHHIGVGGPRTVDTLKGCNMAFRRDLLAFPEGLRGDGAQVAWDMAVALWTKAQGASLVYDPAIVVDHYPAARGDGQSREHLTRSAQYDSVYNSALATCTVRPYLRIRYLLYHTLIGTTGLPGLTRWLVGLVRGEGLTSRLLVSQRGLLAAVSDSRRGKLVFHKVPLPRVE